jgi:hypothetical protein
MIAAFLTGLFLVNLIAAAFTGVAFVVVRPPRGELIELHVGLCAAVVGLVIGGAWVF